MNKNQTGIKVWSLVRKGKDSSGPPCYAVIPSLGSFKLVPTEVKAWIWVTNVQLIIPKLSGKTTRHIRL